MGKKGKMIMLSIAVVAIWGLLVVKVFEGTSVQPHYQNTIATVPAFEKLAKKELQSFQIQANYRDPFLGKPKAKPRPKPILKPKPKPKPKVVFPKITYSGTLSSATQTLYIIKVNNKQLFFKIGQTQQGLTLNVADKQHVEFLYKDEVKSYDFKK